MRNTCASGNGDPKKKMTVNKRCWGPI